MITRLETLTTPWILCLLIWWCWMAQLPILRRRRRLKGTEDDDEIIGASESSRLATEQP